MAAVGSGVGFFAWGRAISAFRHHYRCPGSVRASAIADVETKAGSVVHRKVSAGRNALACPICYEPFSHKGNPKVTAESTSGLSFQCCICKKEYLNNDVYLDLTIASGAKAYGESVPISTELFRYSCHIKVFHKNLNPLVSFLYERGWRQNFVWGGFPGPEREFEMSMSYLETTLGGTIVDASCGSGLFSRQFVKSRMFSHVVALDFSENMLQQCNEFIRNSSIPTENLTLVRADISRLPFASSSIDAVHAGAALHCWPSPSTAVAEISRILRPGGVFVASSFILDVVPVPAPVLQIISQYVAQSTSNRFYLSEGELEELCRTCGLVDFKCVRNGFFVMLSATKPGKS